MPIEHQPRPSPLELFVLGVCADEFRTRLREERHDRSENGHDRRPVTHAIDLDSVGHDRENGNACHGRLGPLAVARTIMLPARPSEAVLIIRFATAANGNGCT